ncbi:MAG: DNA-3-methyladenine glycosylase 2 family protein [Pseudomonadota bacterium]|nr:DNA-3-methyladenine glycosylase 2 family protein [Pseudomonadota bacterium]
MKTRFEFDPATALDHLRDVDQGMGRLIERVGSLDLSANRNRSVFEYLARSIVYQQLSGKAAGTIHGRLQNLFSGRRIIADRLLVLSDQALRGAGLSRGKCLALRDLAARAVAGELPTARILRQMSDADIISALTVVRGIGPWTTQMLLIFYLGRPDVLPSGDLGVRRGYQHLRGFKTLPEPDKLERAGRRWRPYRTVATWYLWRSLDIDLPSS